MRNDNIDKILSIIDNLFGEDDGSPVPSTLEMRNSGLGDAHEMVAPIFGCHQIFEPMTSEIEYLHEQLSEIIESGAELYREKDAYTDCEESLADWQRGLDAIAEEEKAMRKQIAETCGNWTPQFEIHRTGCENCCMPFELH